MLSEQRREEIRKEAHEILERFGKSLGESKIVHDQVEVDSTRIEGKGDKCDSKFKEIMFDNAPNKNEDFIIAEKASW
ncbi:MAG: hypothetical protein AABW79_04010 [Nanoarchaeota archaeon]